MKTSVTHIEVLEVRGAGFLGIEKGNLLSVVKETPKFFFVRTHSGKSLKVSKQTKRVCGWKNINTSPIFNL